jgi:hypothetical protein
MSILCFADSKEEKQAKIRKATNEFVFGSEKAFDSFLTSGWSGSGQADAAAKAGKSGGAYSGATEVAPDVWVYQITKNGLAPQLTLQGTKYYKDDDLNK